MFYEVLNLQKRQLPTKVVPDNRFEVIASNYAALVCGSCGEQVFDSKEAKAIEAQIKELRLWVPKPATI